MENNTIKENYKLEVIPKQEIINKSIESKLLIEKNNKELLPVVISQRDLALIEIRKEFYKVKKHHSLKAILRFFGKTIILLAKLIRWTFLASSRLLGFVVVSAIVILSTTLITKNIINAQYGVQERGDKTTFSIFRLKDDQIQR